MEAALDAIVTVDADGVVVYLNASAEAMFGYERAEAVGRPLAELIVPPGRRDEYAEDLLQVVAGGSAPYLDHRLEMCGVRRDGERFPIELTVTRTGDATFTAFVRDVSEQREAEARRAQMRRLLTSAEELAQLGSWALELPSLRVVWSDGMYRIHGLEPGSLVPDPEMLLDHVHPEDRPALSALLRSVIEDPENFPADGLATEYRAVRPDGTVREARSHGRIEPGDEHRPCRWVGAALDVTEQRLTERELRAHYAIGQALRDWQAFEEGVVGLLRRLATALDVQVGELWTWDDDEQVLRCRAFWSTSEVDADAFEVVTLDRTFRPGEGMPGRAWEQRRPVIASESDPDFLRREAAAAIGLRSAVALPALGKDAPLAVLGFYGTDSHQPSDRLIRTLTGIGRQLGASSAAAAPTCRAAGCRSASSTCCASPPTATPARGSPSSSSSASPRSRPTSSTSTRSSASATAPPPWPTRCAAG